MNADKKLTGVITTFSNEEFDKLYNIQEEGSIYCDYCGSLIQDEDFGCEECEYG
jgi:redox-regulated HSP33 family molecular chaperone